MWSKALKDCIGLSYFYIKNTFYFLTICHIKKTVVDKFIFRHTKNGRLSLFNSLIDIDGNSEIGEKVFRCDSVQLSECEVRLRNLTILTPDSSTNGKCLHLLNCARFEISGCVLQSCSASTDLAPYPDR